LPIEATNKTDLAIRQKSPSPQVRGFFMNVSLEQLVQTLIHLLFLLFVMLSVMLSVICYVIRYVIHYLNGSIKNYTVRSA